MSDKLEGRRMTETAAAAVMIYAADGKFLCFINFEQEIISRDLWAEWIGGGCRLRLRQK